MVALPSLALVAALFTPLPASNTGETVLLQFTADWCAPCRSVKPVVDKLVTAGHPVRVVNMDREKSLAAQHQVSQIPCFVMLVNGQEVDRVVGVASAERLEQMLARGSARSAGGNPPAMGNPPRRTLAQSPDDGQRFGRTSPPAPSPNMPQPASQPPRSTDARLLAATVRLKVEDNNGHSFGTGTLIDARGGKALVLTCGHIFRDSSGKGRVMVDLVGLPGSPQYEGQVLSYDLNRDIGLVMIAPTVQVSVAPVAPTGTQTAVNDRVSSVGCNGGQAPTVLVSRVTGVDKYLGPPNVEVAGMPVEGRSGGGLFDEHGRVVGVCFAADPKDNEGVYAGLASIHAELDRIQLSDIYRQASRPPVELATVQAATPPTMPSQMPHPGSPSHFGSAPSPPVGPSTDPWARESAGRRPPLAPSESGPRGNYAPAEGTAALSAEEKATLAEIYARKRDAEVICIIRPLSDPNGKSEIIVLDRASPDFVQELAGRKLPSAERQLTSHEVPRGNIPPPPRNSNYEWRPQQ